MIAALLVVALCAGLGFASNPAAGAVVSGNSGRAVEKPAHHCRCGATCGGDCCCLAKKASPKPTPKPPTPQASNASPSPSGPCLDQVPCGGRVPEGVPIPPSTVQPAALGFIGRLERSGLESSWPAQGQRSRPIPTPCRLEEPPEA